MHFGQHCSEETKAKLSAANMGHVMPLETRAEISVGNMGKPKSLEARAKMSTAHLGLKATPETRAKMSALRIGPLNGDWKGGRTVWMPKQNAKRRAMGYVPLNLPFPGCEGHHMDNEQVIHMPKELHRSVYHNQTTGQGMAKMNAIAYNFLFKEVETTLEV